MHDFVMWVIGWIPIVSLCLLVFLLFLNPISRFVEDRFIFRDDGYGRKLTEYHRQCRDQGMSYQEATGALTVREHIARLRREASATVIYNPRAWREEIEKAKTRIGEDLALHNPALVPLFYQATAGLPYNHILYEDAARAVSQEAQKLAASFRRGPTEDMYAALNIVDPS